jgi:hypothetical protein
MLSFSIPFAARFLTCPDLFVAVSGMRVYCAGMTTKLAEQKLEQNSALLKVIEKDGAIERLSEQLQSKSRILILSPSFLRTRHNSLSCSPSRDQSRDRAVANGLGVGRGCAEPSTGSPTRVGGSLPVEHRGLGQVRKGHQHGHGRARRVARDSDA